jgi:hypothetical protein
VNLDLIIEKNLYKILLEILKKILLTIQDPILIKKPFYDQH